MDDWNDFGDMPPHNARNIPTPPPDTPFAPSSSGSTLASVSDSSVALLDRNSSSSSDRDRPPSRPPSPHDAPNDRASFLSSLPFLGSKSRRPDASTAAAAADGPPRNTDPGVVPIMKSAMGDRSAEDPGEGMSAASESDAAEPPSQFLPSNRANVIDPEEPGLDSDSYPIRKGQLDDVPADKELNVEGFGFRIATPPSVSSVDGEGQSSVIASSLLRPVEKCYTKLEVITAKQIKSLVTCFNVFVAIAIIYTIMLIILANTKFLSNGQVFLPEQFLTDEQIASADGAAPVDPDNLPPLRILNFAARSDAAAPADPPPWPPRKALFSPAVSQFIRDQYACIGLYPTRAGTVRGDPKPELCVSGDLPWASRQDPVGTEPQGGAPFMVHFLGRQFSSIKRGYRVASHIINFILSFFFFVLGVLFAIRIYRAGRWNITHEQIWVLILIFTTSLYFNAFETIARLAEEYDGDPASFAFAPWVYRIEDALVVIRDVAFAGACYFYLWASLHSYRILDPTKRLGFRDFYLVKLIVLLPYTLFIPLTFYLMDMYLSEVPLMSAPAFAFYFGEFRVWNYLRWEMLCAIAKSLYELFLVIIIVIEATRTMRVLEKAPYMKHRTKRVGFRFFLYMNFVFYTLFIILQCVLLFGKPKGENLSLLSITTDLVVADVLWVWTTGSGILVAGYVLCTAHVHLPHTSVGVFTGWFKSSELANSGSRWSFSNSEARSDEGNSSLGLDGEDSKKDVAWADEAITPVSSVDNDGELQKQIVEPITYRMRESKDSLELKANCFTMQTHVIMFNFSWYVYYHATPKLDNFHPTKNPLPFAHKIAAHIRSDGTDTKALVVDCSDRIIVTFKGTTSMKNLRTSLRVSHERLSTVVRENIDGEDESARLKRLFKGNYLRGKLHRGFATAYRSVAHEVMQQVRQLRERKKRPVFLTGHSLGGALATICSLDMWVQLDISRREIFVSTFGSPRVGNHEFAAVYGEVVPLHWRIVVDPDMIAKLPAGAGYTHVGKKVILTPHGEMIIDPSALEHRPWSGEAAGFAYHRKASYMLAMRAWCVRNHGMTYTPVFWPFPVRAEDERRFAGAFEDEEGGSGRKVASKIIRMDAMVDALGMSDTELANMAVVEKWKRITRRVLLNAKLTGTAH